MLKRVLICLITTALSAQMSFAQEHVITGAVTGGEDGEGLPGVSVIIQGTSGGTVTDIEGKYQLKVSDADAILRFSYVGYISEFINVGNRSTVDITLIPDITSLSEVVVVGYGTQKRAQVTGAITQVKAEDIAATPVQSAAQALQGRAAGVVVINTGAPGTSPVVRVRGLGTINNNNPLYVIDGMIGGDLNTINVNDIESIEVLKDASAAAIYGSRASNGVIMITTKKGEKGAMKINVDGYVGVSNASTRLDVLNTAQYKDYASELEINAGRIAPARFSDPSWSTMQNIDTDWQDEIFQTGIIQNYNLGASGGGENSRYNIGLGYFNQEGVMLSTGFERINVRANTEFESKKFTFGETMNIGFSNETVEPNNGGRSQTFHAIKMAPYFGVYKPNDPTSYWGPDLIDDNDAVNPVRAASLGSQTNDRISINGTAYAQYEIIDGLKYRITLGVNYNNRVRLQYMPSFYDGEFHNEDFATMDQLRANSQSFLVTNNLNYTKTFGDHTISALVVAEQQQSSYSELGGSSQNSITNQIEEINNVETPRVQSKCNEHALISYLARLNYSYKDKYLLSASVRRDGSSRFAEENRWGTFPAVSAGWRLSEESFLSGISAISNLKLRASYGQVGNQLVGDYGYSATISSNWQYHFGAGNTAGGSTINDLPNVNLEWETTTMRNIGIDFGLLEDRIYGSFEYYSNTTENMLYKKPIPKSLGYMSDPWVNIGSAESGGIDLSLGYRQNTGDLVWSVDVNMGANHNEITDLGGVDAFNLVNWTGDNLVRFEVGQPIGAFYGWQTDGIFQDAAEIAAAPVQASAEPGDIRFKDIAGPPDANDEITGPDGVVDANDRTILGNAFPDFSYGLNANLAYKGFDFNLFVIGSQGNEIYNTLTYHLEGMTRVFNAGTAVLNRWTGPGTSNIVPRAISGDPAKNARASDRYIEDGSFMRIRNVTIGYNIPTEHLFGGSLSKFRVYVGAQNLWTMTSYTGYDPEIGPKRDSAQPGIDQTSRLGIDFGNYPQPRTFLGGLQIVF